MSGAPPERPLLAIRCDRLSAGDPIAPALPERAGAVATGEHGDNLG